MSKRRSSDSESERSRRDVAMYVAVGADEKVQRIISAVHRLSKRLNQWYDRQLLNLDLSSGEWVVLASLARHREPLTPSQLAEAASISPSSMTHRLDRMVGRDLVTREPDPDNRTRVLVRLSPAGEGLFTTAVLESNVIEADLMRSLAESDREQLIELLDELLSGLDTLEL